MKAGTGGCLWQFYFFAGLLFLVFGGSASSAAAAGCTDTFTGPTGGSWTVAANWSAIHVPTSGDVACIGSGKTVVISGGTNQTNLVQGEGDLSISSGSLEVTGSEEGSSIGTLAMSGGTQTGVGTLRVVKSFSWTGGAFTGTGSTIILPGAEGTISGGFRFLERRLVNQGTLSLPGGSIEARGSAEIINTGTFTVNSEHFKAAIEKAFSSSPKIVNTGLLQKASGSGETAIEVPIENSGTVAAQTGKLALWAGGSASGGNWEGFKGGMIDFAQGTFSLNGGSLVGAIGISASAAPMVIAAGVSAEGARLELNATAGGGGLTVLSGTMTVESLNFLNGIQTGAGTLRVAKSFSWTGGAFAGAGSTVLLPSAEGTIGGGFRFLERRLVNQGALFLPGGSIEARGGAEIVNAGFFTVNSEHAKGAIELATSSNAKIVNTGVFQKTAGAGTSLVEPTFENNGIIKETSSGHLGFQRPVNLGASYRTGHNCKAGDPVECATGNFTETQTDFKGGGRGIGLALVRAYSAKAAAASSLGGFGYGWTNSFGDRLTVEEGGKKVTLTDAGGSTVPFTQSGSSYLAAAWSQDALSGSSSTGFTLTLADQTEYRFSGVGVLQSIADRNGNETTLAYNGSGKLTTITDSAGRSVTFAYNAEGLIESAKDPMGQLIRYTYEGKQLKTVTLPGEATAHWQFNYDALHRITSVIDGRGGKTINEYDSSSRVVAQTDPAGRKVTFEYAPFHTKVTNKATGAVTDEWFTSYNQPFSVTHGYGTAAATTETFAYDEGGRLIRRTDGLGHTTTYGYDAEGNLTSEKDPLGHETEWTYNGTHGLISTTTPGGETTTIQRDANGNVESISRPAPEGATQTTTFVHDEHGQLESLTDPLGRTWSYGYDAYGDRVSETDPLGHEQTTAYDADSRVTSITTPRGNLEGAEPAEYTTMIERDAQGRPLKVTDPLGHATKYAYDGNGNLTSVTDAKGHTTKYTYNADDERTKVEKPNGDTLQTGYDGAGHITSQTDGRGKATTYVRNVLERPVEVVDPLGRKTTETFDAAGNLASVTDPDERKTTYSYDAAERLTGVDYSEEATPDAGFEYDADGNLTGMVDSSGESSFAYDQLGRLTRSEDGHGEAVEYSYDLGEHQTGIVYPNGKALSRAYDGGGRLESLTDWLGGTTTFGYDADSNLTAIAFPAESANVDEYAYDHAARMSAATFKKGGETLASLTYVRDALGQVEKEARSGLPGPEELSYVYDQNNRLTEAGSASFEYDAADNLTKGMGSTNTYDAASELETGTETTYTYDKLGERTKAIPSSGPAISYGYDQAGNLISISRPEEGEVPAIAEALTYDATGLLVTKASGLATQHLSWDASTQLPLLLADGENSYIYGPNGLPIEQVSASEEPTYLHHDQLGSTRMLTDEDGEANATFSYAPFGALEGKTGMPTTPLGFASQYTDAATGLQYLRARFYDPAVGQFLTRDPSVAVTREPYGYARENPFRFIDPAGYSCLETNFYGLPYLNAVDCAAEAAEAAVRGAENIVRSPTSGLFVGAGCLFIEGCTIARGLLAGVLASTASNALRAGENPCFDFGSHELESLLLQFAGAGPNGLLRAVSGKAREALKLSPAGERLLHVGLDIPGLTGEAIHSLVGG